MPGEMAGNFLMNLLFPVPSGQPFQGGYTPGKPGNPATPQDFTNYSGNLNLGSQSALNSGPTPDTAASFTPYTVDPRIIQSFAARIRGLGPQLQQQAAQMNNQMGMQQLGAQNQWANALGVNPTDPNIGSLNGPTLGRALSQAQAGQLGGQANSLASIVSGLTSLGQAPNAQQVGDTGSRAQIAGNLTAGLDSYNQWLKTQGGLPMASSIGRTGAISNVAQNQATTAGANLQNTESSQRNLALNQNPGLIEQTMMQQPQLTQAQIDAAQRSKGFPGAPTEIYGPGNVFKGSVTVPSLTYNPDSPLGQTMDQYIKQPGTPQYFPADRNAKLMPKDVPRKSAGGSTLTTGGTGTNVDAAQSQPQFDINNPAIQRIIQQAVQEQVNKLMPPPKPKPFLDSSTYYNEDKPTPKYRPSWPAY